MGARMFPAAGDPIRPSATTPVTITVDGEPVTGITGQSIAGVVMACDRLELRRTASGDRPRGVFCGIGVCFDCLVEVNGVQDVRACQRKAREGDAVVTKHDAGAQPQSQPHPQPQLPSTSPVQSDGGAA